MPSDHEQQFEQLTQTMLSEVTSRVPPPRVRPRQRPGLLWVRELVGAMPRPGPLSRLLPLPAVVVVVIVIRSSDAGPVPATPPGE